MRTVMPCDNTVVRSALVGVANWSESGSLCVVPDARIVARAFKAARIELVYTSKHELCAEADMLASWEGGKSKQSYAAE
jgi:hypothetical protein